MSVLRDRSFLAASISHFAVDVLNGQRAILVVALSLPLGLSNAAIGMVNSLYGLGNSLVQPLFGWLADRIGARRVVAGGMLWMTVWFVLAVLIPGRLSLVCLVLAAFGSAAFHPAGTKEAAERGRGNGAGRETTAASVFFLFGQAGHAIGPTIGGPLIERWGPAGLLLMLGLMLPSIQLAARSIGAFQVAPLGLEAPAIKSVIKPAARWTIVVLILLTVSRSWVGVALMAFLPKHLADLGFGVAYYGLVAGLYNAGSALGGVGGAWLADRYGKYPVIVWSAILGSLPLLAFGLASSSPLIMPLVFLGGALIGATMSIIIVLSQGMIPRGGGMASGLVLGLIFASGAVGTYFSGLQADLLGMPAVFNSLAGMLLFAALMGLILARLHPESAEVVRR